MKRKRTPLKRGLTIVSGYPNNILVNEDAFAMLNDNDVDLYQFLRKGVEMELTEERIQEIKRKPIKDRTVDELKILHEVWEKEQKPIQEEKKHYERRSRELEREYSRKTTKEGGEAVVGMIGHVLLFCGWCSLIPAVLFAFYNLFKGNVGMFLKAIVVAVIAFGVVWAGGTMIKSIEELWELRKEKEK